MSFIDKLSSGVNEAGKIQERLSPERVNPLWKAYFEGIING